jgi:hypothetical protein
MKKIIFLFFSLFFNSFAFSARPFFPGDAVPFFESDYQYSSNYDVEYIESLTGKYTDCFIRNLYGGVWYFSTILTYPYPSSVSSCYIIGWLPAGVISVTPVVDNYHYFFLKTVDSYPPPSCPDPSYTSYSVMSISYHDNFLRHSQCDSDCFDIGLSSEECSCPSIYYGRFSNFYVCEMVPPYNQDSVSLEVSQKTAKKKNELLTESNSKLGIIASTNAVITNLLKQIKDALLSLNSANFAIFGTNADSASSSSNKDDPNSPEFEPTLSSSDFNLTSISPLMTGGSTCPSDIPLDLAGSSHYISFKPICEFSQKINPFVVAAARVSAAWIVLGAL